MRAAGRRLSGTLPIHMPLISRPEPHGALVSPAELGRRRTVVLGAAVAVSAVGLGVVVSLRRPSTWTGRAPDPAVAAWWHQPLPTPSGQTLVPAEWMAASAARRLLINFWGSWCPPCVREMPLLDRFHQAHTQAGWLVLGLAVDNLEPVQRHLQRQPVTYPVALCGWSGTEWARALSEPTASAAVGLPVTAVLSRQARVVHRHAGEVSTELLGRWVEHTG